IRNYSRKIYVYAGIIVICFVSVFIRIELVQRDRNKAIVSFVSEWEHNGKPVTVEKVMPKDVPVFTKLSVRGGIDTRAAGFVTGDIKDNLKEGQEIFCTDKNQSCGRILTIGRELDADTGMFSVGIELNDALGLGELAVVFVRTSILANALVVPNEILDFSEGEYYVWKVENGKAKRIQVKIVSRNGYGSVIGEGINPGDVIVFNGRSILSENDKVRIVSDASSRRIEIEGGHL
ncbi:MAG: hypothetical protein PHE58_03930, partial [Candidatus Omnitrophica bacterium]|nr:hypothetical protein [Candidatus Omnitrophota bacterium]